MPAEPRRGDRGQRPGSGASRPGRWAGSGRRRAARGQPEKCWHLHAGPRPSRGLAGGRSRRRPWGPQLPRHLQHGRQPCALRPQRAAPLASHVVEVGTLDPPRCPERRGLWGAGGELHGKRGRRSAPPQGWARDGAQRGHGLRSRVWRPRRAGQQPQSPQPCTPVGPTLAHSRDSPRRWLIKCESAATTLLKRRGGKKSVNKTSVAMETIKNSSPTLPPLLVTYS